MVGLTKDLIDELADELAEEITKQIIGKVKDLVAQKVVAGSGDGISKSLLNIAMLLEKGVAGRFEIWADKEGEFVAPAGTKFIHHEPAFTLFLIEQKPCFRTISLTFNLAKQLHGEGGFVHLPFPYVIFAPCFSDSRFQEMGVYYSNKPLTSLNQPLFYNNLPNMLYSGSILCGGTGERDIGMNLGQRVESTIRGFWNSNFNADANINWIGSNQPFKSLKDWTSLSLLEITKVKWRLATSAHNIIKNNRKCLGIGRSANKRLVREVCFAVAPEIEETLLSSVKKVVIKKEAFRDQIGVLIEKKLGSVRKSKSKAAESTLTKAAKSTVARTSKREKKSTTRKKKA